ncbi:MAG: FAD-binding oxidoreductase [Candidatus Jordarchaeum sp.]|uniref:FAD-binding oxidoreductase n=1 Tax=Candidatus Jordarchaeum sp. TaxID=2823881 RepID=UPI00404A2CA9
MKEDLVNILASIVGEENVKSDIIDRYCYSMDASIYKSIPDVVVFPQTTDQVVEIMKLANTNEIPVTPRGAATGLCGGAVPIEGGIVVDLTQMNKILEIDLDNFCVRVEPGVIQLQLNQELKKQGFFFPPTPGSKKMCTIGGMISTNAGGMTAVKYGVTRNFVLGLKVVLASGEVLSLGGKTLKRSLGLDLTQLFIGSEGTLGIITEALLRIIPLPEETAVIVAPFEDINEAAKAVNSVLNHTIPTAIEIMDRGIIKAVNAYVPELNLPEVDALLYFEIGGTPEEVKKQTELIVETCKKHKSNNVQWTSDPSEKQMLWQGREAAGGAIMNLDKRLVRVYEAEDVCVPISKVPEMVKRFQEISKKYGVPVGLYGHAGDGNIHSGVLIDVRNPEEWQKLKKLTGEVYETAMSLGGNISAEHGIGVLRAGWMDRILGEGLHYVKKIKKVFDPKGILNPGKLGI